MAPKIDDGEIAAGISRNRQDSSALGPLRCVRYRCWAAGIWPVGNAPQEKMQTDWATTMGLYDRDYAQAKPVASSIATSSMVTKIIVITFAAFLVDNFLGDANWLNNFLELYPQVWWKPWNLYRLVTYGFAHSSMYEPRGIWHIAFNMYSLWLFGRTVEQKYGSREFLAIYLALMVLAGGIWTLVGNLTGVTSSLIGASGAVAGIVILFAFNFPHQKFLLIFPPIPVPAWLLGAVIVLLDLRGAMGYGESNIAFSVHLAGAALAALYYVSGARLTGGMRGGWKLPQLRPAPKFKVHRPEEEYDDLDRRADAILDKVHRIGATSLTAEERRVLDDYSRRMRRKRS